MSMESSNNKGDKALTKQLLLPNETSRAGNVRDLAKFLVTGAPENSEL